MFFILTQAGRDWLHANPGSIPNLTTFKLGSSFAYLPTPTQNTLKGLQVFEGTPSAGIRVDVNTIKFSIFIDYNSYGFSFGECLLYMGSTPFAIGTTTTPVSKEQMDGINLGSSLSIDCYVSLNGAGDYTIYDDLTKSLSELNIQNVGSFDRLPSASGATPNVYAVSAPGSERDSILAVSNNALWSFTGYTVFTERVSVLALGSLYIEFPYSRYLNKELADPSESEGSVIVQFLDGPCVGTIRIIDSFSIVGTSTARYHFTTAFTVSPGVGDSIRIYVKDVRASKYWDFLSGLSPSVTSELVNSLVEYTPAGGVRRDSSTLLTANFNMSGYRAVNMADPIATTDAVNLRTLNTTVDDAVEAKTHNSLVGIQGGQTDQYYHLTESQRNYLQNLQQNGIPTASTTTPGLIEIATDAETASGISGLLAVSPSSLVSSIASSTTNAVQDAIINKVKQRDPLVQTGTGAPIAGTTPTTPSLYIDTSVSPVVTYAYNIPNATWYKVGTAELNSNTLIDGIGFKSSQGGTNTFIGPAGSYTRPGTSLTSGTRNVGIGEGAMDSIVTNGNNCVAVGSNALGSATSASATVAIGRNAASGAGAYVDSIFIGSGAGTGANGAVSSIVIGTSAGIQLSGAGNVAVGTESLLSTTSGGQNTCIGHLAGTSLMGSYNVAVGTRAARSVVSSGSTALGFEALGNTVDSSGINIAVGYRAGAALAEGSENTLIGYESGLGLTSAGRNVAIGDGTLRTATSTFDNTLMGYRVGYGLTTGTSNTAIGSYAFQRATTAQGTTAVGSSALGSLTTGNGNCAVGNSAGQLVTTGNANTFVGTDCGARVTGASSNCTAIGNNALGGAGTPAISNTVAVGTFTGNHASAISGSIYIGPVISATTLGANNIGIGNNIGGGGTTSNNIIIGNGAFSAAASTGSGNNVAIGTNASSAAAANRSNTVAIGTGVNATNTGAIAIGASASASAIGSIAIGQSAAANGATNGTIVIGQSSSNSADDALLVGSNVTTAVGATSAIVLGHGNTIGSNASEAVVLGVTGTTVAAVNILAVGTNIATINTSNSVTIGKSTHTSYRMYAASWTNLSDRRDKTNIESISDGLDLVTKLNPVKFRWNMRTGGRTDMDSGFIAQEVRDAVSKDANSYLGLVDDRDEDQLMLSPGKLIPVLVNAIKQLDSALKSTQAELSNLKQQLGA